MCKKCKKGFTLIELLVIISIIGLLSSVVLASLSNSRGKARDAAIKANLVNMRPQAELVFLIPGTYGTAFGPLACPIPTATPTGTLFDSSRVTVFLIASGNLSSANGGIERASCVSTASFWAVSVPLFTDSSKSWCVDSQGASRRVSPSTTDLGFLNANCKVAF